MDAEEIRQVADFAVSSANRAVYQRSQAEPGLRGMGTTLVSAVAWEGQVLVSNVGDSRAYLVRQNSGISRVTRDHSLVERLVELGNITEEQARCHPDRNLITRALGPEEDALSDSYLLHMEPGDYVLLCTDGLIETATDKEMEERSSGAAIPTAAWIACWIWQNGVARRTTLPLCCSSSCDDPRPRKERMLYYGTLHRKDAG